VQALRLSAWRPDTAGPLRTSGRPAGVPDRLADAYRRTTFRVHAPSDPIDIRVGQRCPDLDELLRREGMYCWAFLTAWNPTGRALSKAENRRRDRALRHELDATGATVLPGVGIGDDPGGKPENSLLAVGLDRSAAATLGADFGQDAVVVGDLGAPAELLWCR
jgi:hypothetical protein